MAETGLKKTTTAALSYLVGPFTGILFFAIEKDPFVKFHAMQSIVVFGGLLVVQIILGMTVILIPLAMLLNVVGFLLWLVLIYKAWQGERWEVPFIGKYASQFLKKA